MKNIEVHRQVMSVNSCDSCVSGRRGLGDIRRRESRGGHKHRERGVAINSFSGTIQN